MKIVIRVSEKYSEVYFDKYDIKYAAIFYGIFIPVVHTGISVVAGFSHISISKFLLLTLAGNYVFSAICYVVISAIPSNDGYMNALVYAFLAFFLVYLLHMAIEKMLSNKPS